MIQTLSVACDWNHIKNPTDTFGNQNWGNPNLRDRIIGIAMMILSVPFTLGIGTAYLLYTAHRKVEPVKNSISPSIQRNIHTRVTLENKKELQKALQENNAEKLSGLPISEWEALLQGGYYAISSQVIAYLYVNKIKSVYDGLLADHFLDKKNFYIAKALLSRVVDEGYDYTAFCSKQSSFVFSGYTPEQKKALAETGIDLHAVAKDGMTALDFEFEDSEFANYLIQKGVQRTNNDDELSSFDPDDYQNSDLDFDTL